MPDNRICAINIKTINYGNLSQTIALNKVYLNKDQYEAIPMFYPKYICGKVPKPVDDEMHQKSRQIEHCFT